MIWCFFSLLFVFVVKVKWGRETFRNIEVNTDDEPLVFKAQLFALTGVQPHRQKVMCTGLTLKDDEWNMPIKEVHFIEWNVFEWNNFLN